MKTHEQIGAALTAIKAIADAIKAIGEIPAGHLYAQLMPMGCTLSQFEQITGLLVRSGLVVKSGDVLRWHG